MSHGNQLGPRCVNCDQPIYHTAPDGHWTHTHTGARRCPTANAKSVARPLTIP